MTNLNKNNKSLSKCKTLITRQGGSDNSVCGLHIDAGLLVTRINSLLAYVSDLDGADEAEKNARETTAHIKNIKEIMSLNESLEHMQTQQKQGYTPEEEKALADKLAALMFKNGAFS